LKRIDKPAILSTAYFPNIQFVSKLLLHKTIIIDAHETYLKQSFRNRCQILSANGQLDLSIPIIKPNGNRTITKDVIISYEENWMQVHWRAIVSAYMNSPFFEIFEPELSNLFQVKEKYLVDFNHKCLEQIFRCLGQSLELQYTEKYISPDISDYDFRNSIHPKKRMQETDINFKQVKYYQVFNHKHVFHPNLSFIDLLFNEGPRAFDICRASTLNV
jgi:hypothetical protein